jgi:lipoate-protein ligase A
MIIARFHTAADGIAREAALLQQGRPALILWQANDNAVVAPAAMVRQPGFQAAAGAAAAQGWAVTTRSSGGGIVPQGPATLNLAMILPCAEGFTTDDGYRLICGAMAEALTRFDITTTTGPCPGAFCDGAWNILAQGRKLAGTAQRWRAAPTGRVALIHAAILMQPPEQTLWPVLQALHQVALPKAPLPQPHAHIALNALMPGNMSLTSFPGALVRAAEDRLTLFADP